jgi:hypothetical protein
VVSFDARVRLGKHLTLLNRGPDTQDWFEQERYQVLDDIAAEPDTGLGTNITVEKGCIIINDSPNCAGRPPTNVVDPGTGMLTATIYAKIAGVPSELSEVPGCKVVANWAPTVENLRYGEDDCLYVSVDSRFSIKTY